MKRLGEVMRRDPTATEREAMEHVVDLATAWERGDLSLRSVMDLCTGYERWQAMRFADLGSAGKHALMALVEAIVAGDQTIILSDHGIVMAEELYADQAKATTDAEGARVFVWPMFWMHDEPHYPLVHLAPGEKRREREEAMRAEYLRYRKAKGGGQR